jgi:hypothetical protein
MFEVGSKVMHRSPAFLYLGVEGEVIQSLDERNNWDGQPVFVVNWDDGRAQWTNCKSLDMLVEVAS